MSKSGKTAILQPLQHNARMMRTILATRLLEHGLYAGQDAVLLKLAEEDGLPPGILAQRLGVRPPTITKTITRLQNQGFVVKKASETDQRQSHVYLTPQGIEAIRIIEKSIKKTEKDMLKGLDKKERKAFLKMLVRIENNLAARGSVRLSDELDKEVVDDDDVE